MSFTTFTELAEARYSVRSFSNRKVPKEEIEKIIHAGMVAPTGCNNQPQRIIVVESEEGLLKSRNVQSAILMHRLFLSSAIIRMNAGSGRTMESSAAILMQALSQHR